MLLKQQFYEIILLFNQVKKSNFELSVTTTIRSNSNGNWYRQLRLGDVRQQLVKQRGRDGTITGQDSIC